MNLFFSEIIKTDISVFPIPRTSISLYAACA